VESPDYCRDIEAYLCRKNDGHLIRITGPSFEVVSGWAEQGIPLKVAYSGIDRCFERYYRKGPRRRPLKIDFCDADVLDVFDEWRRATGVSVVSAVSGDSIDKDQSPIPNPKSLPTLPAHLQRVLTKLTSARTRGTLGAEFDELIDRVAKEFDAARGQAAGLRGAVRRSAIDRLASIDAELLRRLRGTLTASAIDELGRDAEADLSPFRSAMSAEAFDRARSAAIDRLVRDRFDLPTVSFGG
jgi:hypothetical protein